MTLISDLCRITFQEELQYCVHKQDYLVHYDITSTFVSLTNTELGALQADICSLRISQHNVNFYIPIENKHLIIVTLIFADCNIQPNQSRF